MGYLSILKHFYVIQKNAVYTVRFPLRSFSIELWGVSREDCVAHLR